MNQDNALAEALKMRNLLAELQPERDTRAARKAAAALQAALGASNASASSAPAAVTTIPMHRSREAGAAATEAAAASASLPLASEFKHLLCELRVAERPVAVVGFREWVFSDKAGALGSFAASSEFAFQVIAGVEYALTPNWRLTADARWLRVGSVRLNNETGNPGGNAGPLTYNPLSVQIGVRYSF